MKKKNVTFGKVARKTAAVLTASLLVGCMAPASEGKNYVAYAGQTLELTAEPTPEPTSTPTSTPEPTAEPTPEPTSTPIPTPEPTAEPTPEPTST
ncbi:MAG: hypothetical protein ACI4QX_03515, partial [Lachnospiraceae bacterium]